MRVAILSGTSKNTQQYLNKNCYVRPNDYTYTEDHHNPDLKIQDGCITHVAVVLELLTGSKLMLIVSLDTTSKATQLLVTF